MVDVFSGGRISFPFPNVETEKGLIGVRPRLLDQLSKIAREVLDEILVKVFAKKVGYPISALPLCCNKIGFWGVLTSSVSTTYNSSLAGVTDSLL